MSTKCASSKDCLFGDLQKDCYESASFSNETFFCDCNNWYGWTGDDCSQTSGQLIYFRFILFLLTFYTASLIAFGIWELREIFHLRRSSQRGTLFMIAAFDTASSFFLFLFAVLQLPAAFDATKIELVQYSSPLGDYEETTPAPGKFLSYAFQIAGTFYFIALLLVGFSWLEVASNSRGFLYDEKRLKLIKRSLGVVIGIFLAVVVVCFFIDYPKTGGVIFCVGAFILGILLSLAYHHILSLLKHVTSSDDMTVTKKFIRRSFRVLIAGLSGVLIFGFTTSLVFFARRDRLGYGSFNYIMFLRDIGCGFSLMLITYTLFYVHRLRSKIQGSSKMTTATSI